MSRERRGIKRERSGITSGNFHINLSNQGLIWTTTELIGGTVERQSLMIFILFFLLFLLRLNKDCLTMSLQ